MGAIGDFLNKTRKQVLQDLVAIDLDPTGVRCVRVKKSGDELAVTAAGVFPAVEFSPEILAGSKVVSVIQFPKHLQAKYAGVSVAGADAVVKLLNLPGQHDEGADEKIREHLGLGEGSFRIAYHPMGMERGGSETRVLAAALPEGYVSAVNRMFPSGLPIPVSVEVSGLAALSAFAAGPLQAYKEEAVGVVEFGAEVSYVAFFNKRELALVRKFDFGIFNLLKKIRQTLGVEMDVARNIIVDGSFDVSQVVREVSDPFVKQLVISRHFVERRESCRVARMYVPGGEWVAQDWLGEIKSAMDMDLDFWDPFQSGALKLQPNALAPELENQKSRFAAAAGIALSAFEES